MFGEWSFSLSSHSFNPATAELSKKGLEVKKKKKNNLTDASSWKQPVYIEYADFCRFDRSPKFRHRTDGAHGFRALVRMPSRGFFSVLSVPQLSEAYIASRLSCCRQEKFSRLKNSSTRRHVRLCFCVCSWESNVKIKARRCHPDIVYG